MRKVKKPVFFIVLLCIIAFGYLTYAGIHTQYGDIKTSYIKGVEDIRWWHALQYAQRPDARRLDLLYLPCRLLRRLVFQTLFLHRSRTLRRRHGHQPPLRLHHPPSAQAGRYTPLHSPGRYVPLRFVGQLFRRADRMGGLRHRFVVMGRGSVRLVDLRQPRPPRSFALQTIRKRVRAGIHLPAPKEDHTFHLLSFQL